MVAGSDLFVVRSIARTKCGSGVSLKLKVSFVSDCLTLVSKQVARRSQRVSMEFLPHPRVMCSFNGFGDS